MSSLPRSPFRRVAEAGLPHGVVPATFPSVAAAPCSQILQPFLVRDLSQDVQMAVSPGTGCSPAAPGQMWWEVVGAEDTEPLWAALPEQHGWSLRYLLGAMLVSVVLGGPVP